MSQCLAQQAPLKQTHAPKADGSRQLLRLSWAAVALAVLILGFSAKTEAAAWPKPLSPIADYAGVYPADQQEPFIKLAQELKEKTQVTMVAVTLPSLDGRAIEDLAPALADQWGYTGDGKERWIILLAAVQERMLRIQVGGGVRPAITPVAQDRVRSQVFTPPLRKENYAEGFFEAGSTLASMVAKEAGISLKYSDPVRLRQGFMRRDVGTWGLLALFPLGWYVLAKWRRRQDKSSLRP